MSGVFAVSRNLFEHDFFAAEKLTEREAWIWLIGEAAWKGRRVRAGKARVDLKRGQCAFSVRFMAEAWGWSKSRVHRFLERLEGESMIGTAAGQGVTVITICKYDEYQRVSLPSNSESGTVAGQQRDSSGTNKNTGENISNTVKEEPKGSSKKRGMRLPEDWTPDEIFARRKGLSAWEVENEAEKFRDYWRGLSGQRAAKADWDATWRNWVRKAAGDRERKQDDPRLRIPGFNRF